MDKTSRRLFFQLVKLARRIRDFDPSVKHSILIGMWLAMKENREDFQIADNQRDIWLHQRCEAE